MPEPETIDAIANLVWATAALIQAIAVLLTLLPLL